MAKMGDCLFNVCYWILLRLQSNMGRLPLVPHRPNGRKNISRFSRPHFSHIVLLVSFGLIRPTHAIDITQPIFADATIDYYTLSFGNCPRPDTFPFVLEGPWQTIGEARLAYEGFFSNTVDCDSGDPLFGPYNYLSTFTPNSNPVLFSKMQSNWTFIANLFVTTQPEKRLFAVRHKRLSLDGHHNGIKDIE